MEVGMRVKIERDEKKFPPRGTWRWFRGRTGTLLEINKSGKGPWEYGVSFGDAAHVEAWFKRHEVRPLRRSQKLSAVR
jgi:hypothetical protein